MLRKTDFREFPHLADDDQKAQILRGATESAHALFSGQNPLTKFTLKSKDVFQVKDLAHRIIVRKVRSNLLHVHTSDQLGRDFIATNTVHMLSENVPYRVYRLDIASFYESFNVSDVMRKLAHQPGFSPLSKKLINVLFESCMSLGGTGIPRGLTLSSTISELVMKDFDAKVRSHDGVYMFYRYVDDIVLITRGTENKRVFLRWLTSQLPPRLSLHGGKQRVCEADEMPRKLPPTPAKVLDFDYLGYNFSVWNPAKGGSNQNIKKEFRSVIVDIAPQKVAKIKTRIVRSFLSFKANRDFQLLALRIKYLTSNFSVKDLNRNTYKLAGIYYNYPRVTTYEGGLRSLDSFLHNAILSKRGRLFATTSSLLTKAQKNELLAQSFARGHRQRTFMHFSIVQLTTIRKCWLHG
jgi:hypothetical protein